ncbi:MAG: sigma-54-dependent Fis family transcriptional regulator [Myxococcota bacterium]|jgi:DNA-binding NtrC family response regulator|nr:sigma-54-dependent Fis family transcriptional regulator [Myxococcota bacterium]
MSDERHGWTTASVDAVPRVHAAEDPTPGLVLVYSRLHPHLPSALPFSADLTTLGREADNSLSIPEAAVSRYHARIERRGTEWWVVDLGSTNGTVVGGYRVKEHRLVDHDLVRVGDSLFRYAATGVYRYGAYRLDGSVVGTARPVQHAIRDSELVGGSQIDAILDRIDKVARTQLSVVVTGESGTGKELVARELHRWSGRQGAFQAINCAALPASLLESELFGYRKGAFTGATTDKVGLVRAAHGGTLFLDEIGDMPVEAQAKLLRVLQERQVTPLGSTTPQTVDVRVVCATHRDLDAFVAEGRFRGDLLARLRELVISLPALRHRREDLFRLVRHFLDASGQRDARVSFPYLLAIAHYDWPYNVRELESAVKLSLALADGRELDLPHLPASVQHALDHHGTVRTRDSMPPASAAKISTAGRSQAPDEAELRALLVRHRGNIAAVGRELGKERMQIHRWLKRYGIDIEDFRDE